MNLLTCSREGGEVYLCKTKEEGEGGAVLLRKRGEQCGGTHRASIGEKRPRLEKKLLHREGKKSGRVTLIISRSKGGNAQ